MSSGISSFLATSFPVLKNTGLPNVALGLLAYILPKRGAVYSTGADGFSKTFPDLPYKFCVSGRRRKSRLSIPRAFGKITGWLGTWDNPELVAVSTSWNSCNSWIWIVHWKTVDWLSVSCLESSSILNCWDLSASAQQIFFISSISRRILRWTSWCVLSRLRSSSWSFACSRREASYPHSENGGAYSNFVNLALHRPPSTLSDSHIFSESNWVLCSSRNIFVHFLLWVFFSSASQEVFDFLMFSSDSVTWKMSTPWVSFLCNSCVSARLSLVRVHCRRFPCTGSNVWWTWHGIFFGGVKNSWWVCTCLSLLRVQRWNHQSHNLCFINFRSRRCGSNVLARIASRSYACSSWDKQRCNLRTAHFDEVVGPKTCKRGFVRQDGQTEHQSVDRRVNLHVK